MILWEIFDVTTTSVYPSAGSVTAPTTAVTARMNEIAVSVILIFCTAQPVTKHLFTRVYQLFSLQTPFSLVIYSGYGLMLVMLT